MAGPHLPRMVLLTTVGSAFEARLLAARLGAEGVLWELRGGDGPYPVGPVHVYVAADDAEVAREVVLTSDPGDAARPGGPADLRTPLGLWLVLVAILTVAAIGLARAVALEVPRTTEPPAGVPAGG